VGAVGCTTESFTPSYLVLPLGGNFKAKSIGEKALLMKIEIPFQRGEI